MAGVVVEAGAAVGEAEVVLEAAEVEGESVREQAVAGGTVTAVSPRGTMLTPAAAWQSVLVVGGRSRRPAASIVPLRQPSTFRP